MVPGRKLPMTISSRNIANWEEQQLEMLTNYKQSRELLFLLTIKLALP